MSYQTFISLCMFSLLCNCIDLLESGISFTKFDVLSQNLSGTDDKKIKIMPASEIGGSKRSNELKIDMKDDLYSSSQEDLKKLQNDTILKRIPAGAEATTVLVS